MTSINRVHSGASASHSVRGSVRSHTWLRSSDSRVRLSSHRSTRFSVWHDSLPSKSLITILVVVSFLLFPKTGFVPLGAEGFDILHNIVFPFSHANIFHLLCNLLCLWQMRNIGRFILPAFLIQFVCSFLPEYLPDIMGLSGFLFAVVGIKCGLYNIGRRMVKVLTPFFLVSILIPNVAMLFHLYCLLLAFVLGYLYNYYRLWKSLRL